MNDVVIDGVKYVPENELECLRVQLRGANERARRILETKDAWADLARSLTRDLAELDPQKEAKRPTIESIYGKPLSKLKAPEGWVFTGEFRIASQGEFLLTRGADCARDAGSEDEARLILRKKSAAPRRRWVFETTGETRLPKSGDWFEGSDGMPHKAECDFCVDGFPILRVEKQEPLNPSDV